MLCGYVLPIFLIITGLFFAIRLRFFYILHPIKALKEIALGSKNGFNALSVALAGTLGIGNIVGVASAISYGGAGSVFWMWVSALCAMSLKYAEVFLSIRFRRFNNQRFYGGAPYYINDGLKPMLGKKASLFLSLFFAILCVINSLTTGNLVQINSVSSILPISKLAFGIVFSILTLLVVLGGIERIGKITSKLIPFLCITYIFLCLYIILSCHDRFFSVLMSIFKDAFNTKSAISGFYGYGISSAIRFGVSRGLISNEAGSGTSPIAHASSSAKSPHAQGCLGIFEVFLDTIILCSLTAFVILLSHQDGCENDMVLVLRAFNEFTGRVGKYIIIISSVMFAFATVISQYFYGSEALEYISGSRSVKTVFTIIFGATTIVGAVIPMAVMWQISDLAIALMTILNLIFLLLLRKEIK
ncbi:MAG: sodium:alanine symporter family protein [Clostridia bacterium]|nr:sodium:alanine symporter family protein [Clostridia bacterium]